tara:strand:- start:1844 stop:3334 length:1491 start_codon:yes stop_codon:yes gene_type:complete
VDEDFDIASFDEAYSPDDFSTDDMNFATAVGQQTGGFGDDNTAQVIANQLAQPQVGLNRSNITNLVSIDPVTGQKTDLYDPTFAAAFDISRGLDPTNNMGGTGGLAVPSYLRPQIESGRVDARGEPIRYFSEGERVIQEDFTDFIRSSQQAAAGIPSLLSSGLGAIKSVFDGLSFLKDSKAGKTVEEAAEDEKRIEIADLEKNKLDPLQTNMTDPSFMAKPIDTVTKTALNPVFGDVDKTTAMDAGASLASGTSVPAIERPFVNLPPDPVMVNQIQRDIARSRGIFDLPQAADLQNNQIAAGEKTGQKLNVTDPGFLQTEITEPFVPETKDKQGPPKPPEKAPPGFVDIVIREDKTPTFAGTNMTIFGGRDPSAKLYSPLTEAEARVATDAGFSLMPIPGALDVSQDPRDYTPSGVLTGVNLPAAEFQFKPDPENVIRVPISSLPAQAQQVAALRSGELDYGTSFPLQTILDARREVDSGNFTQKEMSDFLAGFTR